jgi:competence transcription factor ComK
MKLNINITDIATANELKFYWTNEDYIELLKAFNYSDAENANPEEIFELLQMAITDFEPAEAAAIVLNYKLGDKLTEGQIENISHEMIVDKVAEEYPDPALHFDLFNVNQLLYKAFNGKFINTQATILTVEFKHLDAQTTSINNEIIVKSLSVGLRENNLVHRLFEDQISGKEAFTDAAKVIWYYKELSPLKYEIVTSDYWIDKEDFGSFEFEAELSFFSEDDQE